MNATKAVSPLVAKQYGSNDDASRHNNKQS